MAKELIPQNMLNKLPKLYETEGEVYDNSMCQIKLFSPIGIGTWYIIEYDPEEELAFGYVDLGYPELCYFSLKELRDAKLPYGLKIERDSSWKPQPLSKVEKAHKALYELSL